MRDVACALANAAEGRGAGAIGDRARAATAWLREHGVERPAGAIVLGSGWSPLVARMDAAADWSYGEIPGLPPTSVPGHPGRLAWGSWCDVPCVAFVGRYHLYEGHAPATVALPAMIAAALGCRWILSTTAAGGVRPELDVGQLVAIADDLALWSPRNPFAGPRPRGPVYDPELLSALSQAAREANVHLERGVLAMMPGPSYETAAEIRMLRLAGASVVSMSTVIEARRAHLLGLAVAAVSCVTNRAPSEPSRPLAHEDVLAALDRSRETAGRLIEAWLARLPAE